jgi:ribosomal protein L29
MAKKELLTTKSEGELTSMLVKEREELRTLRFAAAGARPKDSTAPRKTRKQIARILTELHAKKNA